MRCPNPGRTLLTLAGVCGASVVGSRYLFLLIAPEYLNAWGYLLTALLGLWAAASLWVLLQDAAAHARQTTAAALLLALAGGAVSPNSGWYALTLLLPAALGALLLAALLLGLARLTGREAPAWPLLLGFAPLLASVIVICTACALYTDSAVPPMRLGVSSELRYMVNMDRRDRATGRLALNAGRAAARLRLVREFDAHGLIIAPEDQYRAAQLFQQGVCPTEYRRAYELARSAAQAGLDDAEQLEQDAYERWRLAASQPQLSTTQPLGAPASDCGEESR